MESHHSEVDNSNEFEDAKQTASWIVRKWNLAISSLFKVMIILGGKHHGRDDSVRNYEFIEITLYKAFYILQLISLMTSCDFTAEEFRFWEIFRYTRIDWLFFKVMALGSFLAITQAILIAQFCLLVLAAITVNNLKKLNSVAVLLFKFVSHKSTSIAFIPFLTVLIASIKYSISLRVTVVEYESIPSSELNSHNLQGFISIICIIFAICIESVKLIASTNIGYSRTSQNYQSRFTSRFELLFRLGLVGLVSFYFFTDLVHPIFYRCLTFITGMYFAYKLQETLPYYVDRMNFMTFAVCCMLSWAAVAIQFGENLGNVMTSFLLILLVTPLIILGSLHVLQQRIFIVKVSASKLIHKTKEVVQFELCLRHIVASASNQEDYEAVIDHFNNFRLRSYEPSKILDICEVYFCIEFLQDNKLANVKLANSLRPGFDFEAKLHWYRARSSLLTLKDLGDERDFLEFRHKYEQVRLLDEEVSLTYFKLWNELTLEVPYSKNVIQFLNFIYKNSKLVQNMYEAIVRNYPDARKVYELYASFMTIISSDDDRGKETQLLLAKRLNKKDNQNMRNFSYLDETNGIVIVDTKPDNFAKIIYSNEVGAKVFGVSRPNLVGCDLNNFIPRPVKAGHSEKMLNFLIECKKTNIDMPFNIFLYSGQHYLKNVSLIVKLTAYKSHPVILVAIVERPVTKEVAIIDDTGEVYAHSEDLYKVLGLVEPRLEGFNLSDYLGINVSEMQPFKTCKIKCRERSLRLALSLLSFRTTTLKMLFFFTDDEEYLRWEQNKHRLDIEELSMASKTTESIKLEEFTTTNLNKVSSATNPVASSHTEDKIVLEPPAFTQNGQVQETSQSIEAKKVKLSYNSSSLSSNSRDTRQQKMFEKFLFTIKVSRITISISCVALVLGSIVMLVYLVVSVQQINQVFILKMLDGISFEFLKAGFSSRLLSLSNSGLVLSDEDGLRSSLAKSSIYLNDQVNKLKDKQDQIEDYGMHEIFEKDYFRTWQLIDDEPVLYSKNIFDTLELASTSSDVISRLPLADCSLTDPNLYYNYRNGLGEGFETVNKTMYTYIDKQSQFIEEFGTNLLLMIGVSGAILVICSSLVIPSIAYLQKSYDNFWGKLCTIKAQRAIDLKFNVVRRINFFFDSDTIEDLELSNITDLRKARSGDSGLPKITHSIWKKVAAKLSLFLFGSSMLFLMFYQVCFVNIRSTLELYSERAYVASQLKLGTMNLIIWTEEKDYGSIPETDLKCKLSSLHPSPSDKLKDAVEKYAYMLNRIYDPNFSAVKFDQKYVLMDDFGSSNPYFKFGLDPSIILLYHEITSYIDTPIFADDLAKMIKISFEIADLEIKIVASLLKATQIEIDNRLTEAEIMTVCYTVGVLVLCLVVYKRMFNSLEKMLQKTLSIIKLLLSLRTAQEIVRH